MRCISYHFLFCFCFVLIKIVSNIFVFQICALESTQLTGTHPREDRQDDSNIYCITPSRDAQTTKMSNLPAKERYTSHDSTANNFQVKDVHDDDFCRLQNPVPLFLLQL